MMVPIAEDACAMLLWCCFVRMSAGSGFTSITTLLKQKSSLVHVLLQLLLEGVMVVTRYISDWV